jgi:hypothetical protein
MSDVLADADELVVGGRWLEAIEALQLANRQTPDPAIERRLAHVRYAAFDHLEPHSLFDEWPVPVAGVDPGAPACLPEIPPAELDAETVRQVIAVYLGDRPPGLDLLPRRLDRIVETGTGGTYFDWAVGPAVVERLAVDGPVVRPELRRGDAVLFDEMYLHRTAIDAAMTRPRYAIESWFFAPTSYPPTKCRSCGDRAGVVS